MPVWRRESSWSGGRAGMRAHGTAEGGANVWPAGRHVPSVSSCGKLRRYGEGCGSAECMVPLQLQLHAQHHRLLSTVVHRLQLAIQTARALLVRGSKRTGSACGHERFGGAAKGQHISANVHLNRHRCGCPMQTAACQRRASPGAAMAAGASRWRRCTNCRDRRFASPLIDIRCMARAACSFER